jgi:hypothetical protein
MEAVRVIFQGLTTHFLLIYHVLDAKPSILHSQRHAAGTCKQIKYDRGPRRLASSSSAGPGTKMTILNVKVVSFSVK